MVARHFFYFICLLICDSVLSFRTSYLDKLTRTEVRLLPFDVSGYWHSRDDKVEKSLKSARKFKKKSVLIYLSESKKGSFRKNKNVSGTSEQALTIDQPTS